MPSTNDLSLRVSLNIAVTVIALRLGARKDALASRPFARATFEQRRVAPRQMAS